MALSSKKYNKDLRILTNNKAAGSFFYPLSKADHAAALAYCQALDIARGKTPYSPPLEDGPTPAQLDQITSAAIAATRARAIAESQPIPPAPYLPKEMR